MPELSIFEQEKPLLHQPVDWLFAFCEEALPALVALLESRLVMRPNWAEALGDRERNKT